MSDNKNYKPLRIFIASPSDVATECARVHAVADELNQKSNIAESLGLQLEVLDWQSRVAPLMGRPEDAVLQQLPVDTWDIFIGILWLRFGTPPGAIDPQTGNKFDSGTEEEFGLAYRKWKISGRPKILFYRCNRPPVSLDEIDPDQYKSVKSFFARFEAESLHPGLYQSFQTSDDFERHVRRDLTKLVLDYGSEVLKRTLPQSYSEPKLSSGELKRRLINFDQREHGHTRLIGFLSKANIDVRLLDLFVSLHFSEYGHDIETKPISASEMGKGRILTTPQILQRAIQKKKSLLILGGPGSGKTTILKYFAVRCLDSESREQLRLEKPLIPILVPLRQIDPSLSFTKSLALWARNNNLNIAPERFETWLHHPGALVLLDGLDEVSDLAIRKKVCEWIDKAAPAYGESTFVITCRFTGYREAKGVFLQTPHLIAHVLDLEPSQQQALLRQWFRATALESLDENEIGDSERSMEIDRDATANANAVMEFLNRHENRSLREMAGIPVLLQIMAIIWKEHGSLSGERVTLYSRCIDYLLEQRDQAKKIEPLISASKARLVLRLLALWMQAEWKQNEVPGQEIEKQIAAKLQEVQPGITPSEFLENIRDRAGVFVGASTQTYTFQHSSFREFFAAIEIANQHRADLLVENFDNDWWQETLLFSAGLTSPEIFPEFIEKYLTHEKNNGPTSPLLLQLVREATAKPIAPFQRILYNKEFAWQKRYNALQCVRLLRSDAAIELVKVARQDIELKVRQLAEQILIERGITKSIIIPGMPWSLRPDRFFNPVEENAEYILIPAGTYKFSLTGETVQVPDLYFAKYPVSNKLYKIFLASLTKKEQDLYRLRFEDDKRFNGDDQPMIGVTWYSAVVYCQWLTEQVAIGRGQEEKVVFRLPAEEEWEWAAGKGKRKYPWGNDEPDDIRANYGKKVGHTTSVGSYPAGATLEGLMDMAGNVWEWMKKDEYTSNTEACVLRGGSWDDPIEHLCCTARSADPPDDLWHYDGFRVVCSWS